MEGTILKRLYSVKEAGRYLGRSPWAVRDLIKKNILPHVRQGRRVMVDVLDMDRFIEKYKQEVADGLYLPSEEAGPSLA